MSVYSYSKKECNMKYFLATCHYNPERILKRREVPECIKYFHVKDIINIDDGWYTIEKKVLNISTDEIYFCMKPSNDFSIYDDTGGIITEPSCKT